MSMIAREALTISPAMRAAGQSTPPKAGAPGLPDRGASLTTPGSGEAPVSGQPVAEAHPPEGSSPSELTAAQPGGGLASLRMRARLAQAQLGDQPLSIANQSSRLVMKLLGG